MVGCLLAYVPVLVFLYLSAPVEIDAILCNNFEQQTSTCFNAFNMDVKKGLEPIILNFEKGMPDFCKLMKEVLDCVNIHARDCTEAPDASVSWKRYQGVKHGHKSICEDNRQAFDKYISCVRDADFKTQISACQANMGDRLNCESFKTVIKCVDLVLDKRCADLHLLLGDVFRRYLGGVNQLKECNVPHEGHGGGSLSVNLSVTTVVTFLVVTLLAMRP